MTDRMDRRGFLKTAPAAASVLAVGINFTRGNVPDVALDVVADGAPDVVPAVYPAIGAQRYPLGADYPITAKRFSEVTLTDAFWKPKIATNAAVTIPFEADRQSGQGGQSTQSTGLNGNVLEAAIYSLQTHPDAALQSRVDARIASMAQAMTERQTLSNNSFEVAVALFNATGKRTLLDPAIKIASALHDDFKTRRPPFSGGERDAINCLQLYRATHDKKHLDLAKHYLDIRGLESSLNRSRHNQSYKPVLDQREAVGHAVNGVTLMVSMADVGVLTGLTAYFDAAQRMWTDAVSRKMYITGGVGSTGNEGFGEPYSLPNVSAYAETCAVLYWMTLNLRMFQSSGNSKYIDVIERGMYNNALSGVSHTGNRFFYVNRLASAGDGRDTRWERASLECCPPNLVRFLATMPGYIYAQDKHTSIYVNLYVSSESSFKLGSGKQLSLAVESEMPWGGKSTITVSANSPTQAGIKLRVPGWARNTPAPGSLYSYADRSSKRTTLRINSQDTPATVDALGYITLDRVWKSGDSIVIEFPIDVRRVIADTRVREDRGRVAIERGPIVYCAEWPDCEGGNALDLSLESTDVFTPAVERVGETSCTVINTTARSLTNPGAAAKPVRLIPYHMWANRGAGQMTVWLNTREYMPGDVGPAGGHIFYVNTNSSTDGWRYLEAAPFDQSSGAKWGCFRRAMAGARGTEIGAGKQNTVDMLSACGEGETAAALCKNLNVNGFSDWFLPSRDELAAMYTQLRATNVSDFGTRGVADNFSYWTSTQQTTDMANHIDFADNGRQHYDDKDFPRRVRAVRAF